MNSKLSRELGVMDIFCLASGAMISSGIFILPGLAYAKAGPLVFVSYILAGTLALVGTLSIIELSTAMPKAGGDYFFITRSQGPLAGTISSFLSWTALCLKSAFAIFGISEILHLAFGAPVLASGFFICVFFVVLNLTGLFIFICLTLDLSTLVKLGSVVILTLYMLTNTAVIILREGRVQNYMPAFRIPFYPWTNIAGIGLFTLMIVDMGFEAVEISVSLVLIAATIYFLYGRKRHRIEYALMHLVERVINRKITTNTLEEELKGVIIHRDELRLDRFHRLVEEALVMDLGKRMKADEFFGILSEKISSPLRLSPEETVSLLREREEDGSTAITPFVAIPHIIIPGENRFSLAVVRNSAGIDFTREHDDVKAVFVLFGTKDERTFHLRVLSAIAHIVQNPGFEKAWMGAKNVAQLRDILLLSERKRL